MSRPVRTPQDAARRSLPRGAWAVAAVVVVALVLVGGRYGFHGDEFYFVVTGRHAELAAPDNPVLVPYLAAAWYALVGGHLWAFRVLPALAAGGYVLVGAVIAREFGAPPRHQVAAAVAVAMTGLTLGVGHLFETTTFDMLTTAAAIGMLVRALRAEPQRWAPWLAAGVLTGVALEIKIVAAPVLACCLLGVPAVGRRRGLVGPRVGAATAIALVLAAPNLVWQVGHGFPMGRVAAAIAAGGSTSSTPRPLLVPTILLEVGPVISVVLVVGLVVLLRPGRRGVDGWLAVGFLLFVALLLATGGKAYYPAGFYPAVLAAGAGPTLEWITARRWRRAVAIALAAVSLVVTPSLSLPLYPAGSALYAVATGPNPDLASEVGWPEYVSAVGHAAAALPPAERAHAIILTSSYAEAAALELRPPDGVALPPVFSGHNAYWYWGPPPDAATDAVVVGRFSTAGLARLYADCTPLAAVATAPGVDNDLTGLPVRRCTGRRVPWSVAWPQLAHVG